MKMFSFVRECDNESEKTIVEKIVVLNKIIEIQICKNNDLFICFGSYSTYIENVSDEALKVFKEALINV